MSFDEDKKEEKIFPKIKENLLKIKKKFEKEGESKEIETINETNNEENNQIKKKKISIPKKILRHYNMKQKTTIFN